MTRALKYLHNSLHVSYLARWTKAKIWGTSLVCTTSTGKNNIAKRQFNQNPFGLSILYETE